MARSSDTADHLDLAQAMASAVGVSGITTYLKTVVEEDPGLQQVWVLGEVSSANSHAVGLFFTLKDPEQERDTLNCVVWNRQQGSLSARPQVGQQVVVRGSARLYAQRSTYQLQVNQVLPLGEGLQALRYRQLKQRLWAEGLFDPAGKLPLPSCAHTIAVVTSPQAAAWGDIQRTLRQHHPGLRVLFSPATVQGPTAAASIAAAVARVVQDGRAEVLILARGGGASEDLECFNDEQVVRAVATCPLPVVTGIGHQRDESLADLAADLCAATPTAAATAVVPSLATLQDEHQGRRMQLYQALECRKGEQRQTLDALRQRLKRQRLDQVVAQHQTRLSQYQHQLRRDGQIPLQRAADRCAALGEQLAQLAPQGVLRRGYAWVKTAQGTVVTQASQVAPGQPLTIQLGDGQVTVVVQRVAPATGAAD